MPIQWKAPGRPDHKISQTYNSGLLSVFAVSDAAEPGLKPRRERSLRATLPFDERRVGVGRFYQSAQAMAKIERVLRIPRSSVEINIRDQVSVTGSEALYRVEQVQSVPDVWPESLDISLSRIDADSTSKGGAQNG